MTVTIENNPNCECCDSCDICDAAGCRPIRVLHNDVEEHIVVEHDAIFEPIHMTVIENHTQHDVVLMSSRCSCCRDCPDICRTTGCCTTPQCPTIWEVGVIHTFPPMEPVIRFQTEIEDQPSIYYDDDRYHFRVVTEKRRFTTIDLPAQRDDVFMIVSSIVQGGCPDRDDLLVPANVVRDEAGNVLGCRALGR